MVKHCLNIDRNASEGLGLEKIQSLRRKIKIWKTHHG